MTSQGKGLSLQEGQKVLHPTLGDGVVLSVSVTGQPARQVALIDFECGPTKVIPSLVELTILSDAPAGRDTGWEDPLPFDWPTKLPGWPSGVFPPVVAAFAAALAEDTQTPLDFVGVAVLGILAASVGGRVDVRCSTHTEPTNLFVVPVLPPGSRKSAVIASCRAALDTAEVRLLEELGDEIRAERTKRKILEQHAEACVRDAAKDPTTEAIVNAQEAEKAAAAVPVRAFPRLVTSDATPEAMVTLLAEQGGRIAAISAEAGPFASLTGRYTKSPNLDPVLMSHAGDPIRVDRRSREPEKIERPALTLLASIQPYALLDMVARPDFAGRGLLARVLWSLPADLVGRRKVRGVKSVPDEIRAAFGLLIETLAVDMGKRTETVIVRVSEAAEEVRLTYAEKVEMLLRPDGELGSHNVTREWGSKLAGAVLRIAGCLHAARGLKGLSDPISVDTMQAAISIGEYFRAHAVGALIPRGDDTRIGNLQHVLTKLVDMGAGTFTTRELHRKVQRRFPRAPQLTEVLEELATLGWLRPAEKGFVLHPDAKALLDLAKNPGDSGDSGDNREGTAGQATYGEPPEPVTTPGDSGDNSPDVLAAVTTVTTPGDSLPVGVTVPLSREDAGIVTAVTAVTGVGTCAGCGDDMKILPNSGPTHPNPTCEAMAR